MTRPGNTYDVEYTDTFGGEPNYSWVKRAAIWMPEMTHYGYDGSTNYSQVNKVYEREIMKKAKAEMGLTGVRGTTSKFGDTIEFRPSKSCTVLSITFKE